MKRRVIIEPCKPATFWRRWRYAVERGYGDTSTTWFAAYNGFARSRRGALDKAHRQITAEVNLFAAANGRVEFIIGFEPRSQDNPTPPSTETLEIL